MKRYGAHVSETIEGITTFRSSALRIMDLFLEFPLPPPSPSPSPSLSPSPTSDPSPGLEPKVASLPLRERVSRPDVDAFSPSKILKVTENCFPVQENTFGHIRVQEVVYK